MAFDLKAHIRERGLRQKSLAHLLGVSEPAISLWAAALAQGHYQRVPAERARALADALKISPGLIRPDLWPAAEAA